MKNTTENSIRTAFAKMTAAHDGKTVSAAVERRIRMQNTPARRYTPMKIAAALMCTAMLLCTGVYAIAQMIKILPDDHGYTVERTLEVISIPDTIREELWQNCGNTANNQGKAAYTYGRKFDTWEEAEAYLGIDLLCSDLLGSKPENVIVGGEITLISYADNTLQELQALSITATHSVQGYSDKVNISVFIPLTAKAAENGDLIYMANHTIENGVLVPDTAKKSDISVSSYMSPLGLSAELASTMTTADSYTKENLSAHLVYNGIGYSISADAFTYMTGDTPTQQKQGDADSIEKMLKDILDSLH